MSTTATTPARAATGGRDRYFDVLRTACIVWVVFYHVFATQSWLGFWPAMGILFALSSTLMVRSLDRSRIQTLRSRLRRLLPVLWLLGVLAIPLMIWHDGSPTKWTDTGGETVGPIWRLAFWIFPLGDPLGSGWAESATEPIWYLRTLVWFILLSPILLILFRWYPKTMMLGSVALLVGMLTKKVGFDWSGGVAQPVLTDGFTFLACWFLGFAHHEGMLKKIPKGVVVAAGLTLAAIGIWWVLGHKVNDGADNPSSYDFNLFDGAQGLYSLGIAAVLLRFSPKFAWIDNYKALDRVITIINGRAMVIYLWHNVAIELSYPIGDRFNVWQYGTVASTLICLVIALLLTAVGVLAFGWIEDVAAGRKPQLLPKTLGKKDAAPADPAPPAETASIDTSSTVMFSPNGPGSVAYDSPHYDNQQFQPAYNGVGGQFDDRRYDDQHANRQNGNWDHQNGQVPHYDESQYNDGQYRDGQYSDGQYRDGQYGGGQYGSSEYSSSEYGGARNGGPQYNAGHYDDRGGYHDRGQNNGHYQDDQAYSYDQGYGDQSSRDYPNPQSYQGSRDYSGPQEYQDSRDSRDQGPQNYLDYQEYPAPQNNRGHQNGQGYQDYQPYREDVAYGNNGSYSADNGRYADNRSYDPYSPPQLPAGRADVPPARESNADPERDTGWTAYNPGNAPEAVPSFDDKPRR